MGRTRRPGRHGGRAGRRGGHPRVHPPPVPRAEGAARLPARGGAPAAHRPPRLAGARHGRGDPRPAPDRGLRPARWHGRNAAEIGRIRSRPGAPSSLASGTMDWTTPPEAAAAHFAARLACETDVSDVHAALESGDADFVLLDSRSTEAWAQGHVPGAVHLPGREIAGRADAELDRSVPVVTYCWGPGCN